MVFLLVHCAENIRGEIQSSSPKVLVHGLEKEFVVWLVEDLFKIQQGDIFCSYGDLHQVRGLLLVDVIDDFGLRHLCAGEKSRTFSQKRQATEGAEVALTLLGTQLGS